MYSNIYIRQLKSIHWNGHCNYDFKLLHLLLMRLIDFRFPLISRDDDYNEQKIRGENSIQVQQIGSNPFLETPPNAAAIEYKKGYVMRKCCYDANNKKSRWKFSDAFSSKCIFLQ